MATRSLPHGPVAGAGVHTDSANMHKVPHNLSRYRPRHRMHHTTLQTLNIPPRVVLTLHNLREHTATLINNIHNRSRSRLQPHPNHRPSIAFTTHYSSRAFGSLSTHAIRLTYVTSMG